jgi:hypothetical protein
MPPNFRRFLPFVLIAVVLLFVPNASRSDERLCVSRSTLLRSIECEKRRFTALLDPNV